MTLSQLIRFFSSTCIFSYTDSDSYVLLILYIKKAIPTGFRRLLRIILSFQLWSFTVQWTLLLSISHSAYLRDFLLTTLHDTRRVIRLSCLEKLYRPQPVFLILIDIPIKSPLIPFAFRSILPDQIFCSVFWSPFSSGFFDASLSWRFAWVSLLWLYNSTLHSVCQHYFLDFLKFFPVLNDINVVFFIFNWIIAYKSKNSYNRERIFSDREDFLWLKKHWKRLFRWPSLCLWDICFWGSPSASS